MAIAPELRSLFDERVRFELAPVVDVGRDALPDAERALVARAVPKRVREFAGGRILARRMLSELGRPCEALLRGAHGSVAWPGGVQGTLSHCGGWVGAAVTADPSVAGLGLDIEDDAELEERYWHVIMTAKDMEHLESWDRPQRPRIAKVIFSAKEAAYKAQFPVSQTFLPFSAMHVAVERPLTGFTATFHRSVSSFAAGDEIKGSIAWFDGNVVTAVTLDTRP